MDNMLVNVVYVIFFQIWEGSRNVFMFIFIFLLFLDFVCFIFVQSSFLVFNFPFRYKQTIQTTTNIGAYRICMNIEKCNIFVILKMKIHIDKTIYCIDPGNEFISTERNSS